jgi:hypothetical protein
VPLLLKSQSSRSLLRTSPVQLLLKIRSPGSLLLKIPSSGPLLLKIRSPGSLLLKIPSPGPLLLKTRSYGSLLRIPKFPSCYETRGLFWHPCGNKANPGRMLVKMKGK